MQPLGVDEPTAIGPYRLLGRLGSGGMGRVYLGRSAGGRTVAVKVVHPHLALDEEFRARFRREVEAARRVGGAWTAPVLDADPLAPVPWVATAYAAGPSLAAAVADGGPLPVHSVRALGAGLAEALAAVHELGLVHRDVKPSNVLLTLDGPLLIDFGIARALDGTASLTSTGVSIGSPGYMAPEQILGKGVTGAADVFSLGAVLAYAAAGEPPFPGDSSAALLYKVVHEEPLLDALEGELRDVVAGCLAKQPGARPTPGEVARRLAPEGAARLVAAGWLPGALVTQVSRGAVRLLNLEAAGAGAPPSGPGESGGPAGGGGAVADAGRAGGAGTDAADAGPTAGAGAALGAFGPPPVMPGAVPEPCPAEPEDAVADPGGRPGKVSVSVAATAAPEAGGRGRRLSCTVVLAVAGAFAAATVGSVLVLDLLPGEREDSAGGAGHDASSSAPSAGPTSGPSDIPARYLGTWEGQGTALDGTLPAGTFRVTVRQAEVGQELGRLRQTDQLGGVCVDVLTLQQVTEKQLVARSVGEQDNHGGCNQEATTVRLVPTGDDLMYTSDSARSGHPQARMSKVE
ncbi:serine/threonine-protein kinase [Streptomyces chromofuscus]|uniref:Serine/threonine protein kinase n=1 Tax=Streptomyces chromofuscus TaxID=42881 RepID=A0A7M2TID8_STRCW|nr:serine/threonine-protein kinase [Streptomyces chromofuscus]QOV47703.1 serine/threonine protein kinase [Streptomyces chromofuscus]